MNAKQKLKIASGIVSLLVHHNLSALEVIEVLKEAEKTFLERSWHIASEKQHANNKI
ncbi:hypothetical protein [Atopobacter phocae]|uniref:hypothetical protein n=1 Tax=Atopobacter phocae TaxID=136492 RepID=UPI0004B26586|nr:hypothetical protein [Atopobacter phocae]